MGEKLTLTVEERVLHGKKVAQLRKDNLVPGVIYGQGFEPISVQAVQQVINKIYRAAGKHHAIYLTVAGKRKIAMIKDIDIDPLKNTINHISFHAVKQNEKIEADIPVRLVGEGESPAEKAGLIVLQTIEKLEVRALPMELPDALEVSIMELSQQGDRITVGDIKLPENVELVDNKSGREDDEDHDMRELVVASVYEPSALAAQNDAAGGDAEDESEVTSEQGSAEATETTTEAKQ